MRREMQFMQEAINVGLEGMRNNLGGPFGCVIVKDDKIIGKGCNSVIASNDPTAHAEMIALTSAFNLLGSKYLSEAILYVTVEPCLMCAGAMYWSKIGKIVWGADDEKNGHKRITGTNWPFHQKSEIVYGVLKEECGQLMKDFFKKKR